MEVQSIPGHKIEATDMNLAGIIANALNDHYPNWGWAVHVDSEGGLVNVLNHVISGSLMRDYGYTLMLSDLTNYKATVKKAITAGGELLERAGVPRGPYKGQDILKVEGAEPQDQPIWKKT